MAERLKVSSSPIKRWVAVTMNKEYERYASVTESRPMMGTELREVIRCQHIRWMGRVIGSITCSIHTGVVEVRS